jgi:hypothetical protein
MEILPPVSSALPVTSELLALALSCSILRRLAGWE